MIAKKYKKQKTNLTTSTKTLGRRVTRNEEEEIYYSAELNEVTGETHLTGSCPEYDIDGEDFFVADDGREFKMCPNCFVHIVVNNSCMGAKAKRCKFGIQLDDRLKSKK